MDSILIEIGKFFISKGGLGVILSIVGYIALTVWGIVKFRVTNLEVEAKFKAAEYSVALKFKDYVTKKEHEEHNRLILGSIKTIIDEKIEAIEKIFNAKFKRGS